MNKISKLLLNDVLGWTIKDEFPPIKKSVIIFAPHTSYFDGLFGKLYFMQQNVNYKFLSKEEFFIFPLKYFFKAFGSIPVYRNSKYIDQVVNYIHDSEELHIVLSPEGQLAETSHWKKGFYYMANRADVPIVVAYIDYKKKELGIKGIIKDTTDMKTTMKEVAKLYDGVNAKFPKDFSLDKRYVAA